MYIAQGFSLLREMAVARKKARQIAMVESELRVPCAAHHWWSQVPALAERKRDCCLFLIVSLVSKRRRQLEMPLNEPTL